MAAEPSGLWGSLKEAFASSSALAAAKADPGSNELVKAVVAEFETPKGRSSVQDGLRKLLAGLSQPTPFSDRLPICGKFRRSLLPKRQAMPLRSRLG